MSKDCFQVIELATAVITPCGHIYCYRCIETRCDECPNCGRGPIQTVQRLMEPGEDAAMPSEDGIGDTRTLIDAMILSPPLHFLSASPPSSPPPPPSTASSTIVTRPGVRASASHVRNILSGSSLDMPTTRAGLQRGAL
ncbi:hypothetical protein K402DRAFT_453466 [Aulographum hederae CBS 113979]|uniref:RING-type domain-containing protein n=1 Tax=Aulographum hederae CBS 113979 TaxID=1176131 RepID=A0A6G1H3L9_9PEZI|nr:hypothetical protein K402DRAFT_453466 [Aulographum hederae CBS 113979]